MANKNRTKGLNAEREYAKMFREMGYSHCITARYGSRMHDDCGIDLLNTPYNVQIKSGYAKGINYSKVLREIAERVFHGFPKEAPEHLMPNIIIHRKDAKRGQKRTEFDELVVMTLEDFKKIVKK